ncbi:hydrogenase maturation nickel metallochaperone HypA [Candidatus Margulisiibacteriota bacterium]
MHELHLVQDVLTKIKAEAKGKVTYAKVKIGQSLITDPAEFEELFKQHSGGIQLDYEIVPLKAVCADCGNEFDSKTPRLDCPYCGSTNIKLTSGKELIVEILK